MAFSTPTLNSFLPKEIFPRSVDWPAGAPQRSSPPAGERPCHTKHDLLEPTPALFTALQSLPRCLTDFRGKATSVPELASFLAVHIRVDHHILGRSIFCPQARGIRVKCFVSSQPGKNVLYDVLIQVEVAYESADIFAWLIAHGLEFKIVRPEDSSVPVYCM